MKPGVKRLRAVFEDLKQDNRAALMPYYPLGYPDASRSLEIIERIARSGADILELGIPFSDPLADGPTIAFASQIALDGGITVEKCLNLVHALRDQEVQTPAILMGYINPILAYGMSDFVQAAVESGADGFIIPDLPPEEAGELEGLCQKHDLGLIYLIAPTTPPERTKMLVGRSTGFCYLVSLTGVTGARNKLPAGLEGFIRRTRSISDLPVAVGFGISTPEQAGFVSKHADGVIVGSALIDAVRSSGFALDAAEIFIHSLLSGLNSNQHTQNEVSVP